jgi:hypothetical protein
MRPIGTSLMTALLLAGCCDLPECGFWRSDQIGKDAPQLAGTVFGLKFESNAKVSFYTMSPERGLMRTTHGEYTISDDRLQVEWKEGNYLQMGPWNHPITINEDAITLTVDGTKMIWKKASSAYLSWYHTVPYNR